jgi:hypothetical protein
MDESKPSIPPSEFRLRSAYERTSADIDLPPAELALRRIPRALAMGIARVEQLRTGKASHQRGKAVKTRISILAAESLKIRFPRLMV